MFGRHAPARTMRNAAAGQALPLPETLTAFIRGCVENAKRRHQQHFHTRKRELGECGRLVNLGMPTIADRRT